MKTNPFISTTALALLLTLPQLKAQPHVSMARGPIPPGPELRTEGMPREPNRAGLITLTTLSGTVQQLTANDEAILNGFVLGTGSSTVIIRFPARMGKSISNIAKTGSSVTVSGYSKPTPEGESVFQLVNLTAGKTTVTDTPANPPAVLPTPSLRTFEGKVAEFLVDKQGRTRGLLLTDQTLIKVPPHVADQLVSLAPKGSSISVNGFQHSLGDGEVQLNKRTIVQAAQLTVNGQTFLVR
ncbi:hypothetical protein ACFQ4C_08195 [Larkinella insperata]|uniref:DUF5666 domain-containing protein n=1 Tax=Larkinella insperata TaxID=332158 RepID=A0ABW3QCS0_9BACT